MPSRAFFVLGSDRAHPLHSGGLMSLNALAGIFCFGVYEVYRLLAGRI